MMRNSLEAYLQIKKSSTVLWDTTWCFHFLWYVLKTFLSSIPNIKVININGISGMHGLKNICVYALPFRKYFLRTYYMCCDVRTLYIYTYYVYTLRIQYHFLYNLMWCVKSLIFWQLTTQLCWKQPCTVPFICVPF